MKVRPNALMTSPDRLDNLIVAHPVSGPVYLKDVATVVDSHTTTQVIDRVNGVSAVTATKSLDANTLAATKAVREAMAGLQPNLPEGCGWTSSPTRRPTPSNRSTRSSGP